MMENEDCECFFVNNHETRILLFERDTYPEHIGINIVNDGIVKFIPYDLNDAHRCDIRATFLIISFTKICQCRRKRGMFESRISKFAKIRQGTKGIRYCNTISSNLPPNMTAPILRKHSTIQAMVIIIKRMGRKNHVNRQLRVVKGFPAQVNTVPTNMRKAMAAKVTK